jgi:hypothetical protein
MQPPPAASRRAAPGGSVRGRVGGVRTEHAVHGACSGGGWLAHAHASHLSVPSRAGSQGVPPDAKAACTAARSARVWLQNRGRHEQKRRGISATALVLIMKTQLRKTRPARRPGLPIELRQRGDVEGSRRRRELAGGGRCGPEHGSQLAAAPHLPQQQRAVVLDRHGRRGPTVARVERIGPEAELRTTLHHIASHRTTSHHGVLVW